MTEVIISLRVTLEKPVPDLAQIIAQRGFCVEGVANCEVVISPMQQAINALQRISTITNKLDGTDWEEIEQAREIAITTLSRLSVKAHQ